jgi:hypothetical protein
MRNHAPQISTVTLIDLWPSRREITAAPNRPNRPPINSTSPFGRDRPEGATVPMPQFSRTKIGLWPARSDVSTSGISSQP